MSSEVKLTYIAELRDLREKLKSIPDITGAEARKAVKELDRSIREVARQQDRAVNDAKRAASESRSAVAAQASTARQAAAATQNLKFQLFDIGQGLLTGQSPFTILAQQAPQVVQAMSMAGGGLAALRAALVATVLSIAPIVAVVGTGYVAWRAWNEETERARQITEDVRAAQEAMRGSLDARTDATVRLRVATGELTAAEGRALEQSIAAHRAYQAATEDTRRRVAELRAEQGSLKTQAVDLAEGFFGSTRAFIIGKTVVDALTTSSAEYGEQITALQTAQAGQVDALRAQVEATHQATTAEDAAAQASRSAATARRDVAAAARAQALAYREVLQLMDEEQSAVEASRAAIERLREASTAAMDARREGASAAAAATRAELRAIEQTFQVAIAQATNDQLRLEAIAAYEEAKAQVEATGLQRRLDAEKAASEARQALREAELEQVRAQAQAHVQAYSQMAGATQTAFSTIADSLADNNRRAALAAFAVAKGAALAQVVVDTALAVSKISAAWAAVPPVQASLTAAALATGAAQAAVITAQQPAFHTGGLVSAGRQANDEVNIRGLRSELAGVLSSAAISDMGGPRAVEAANDRRVSGGGNRQVIELHLGARIFDRLVLDASRRTTSPLSRTVRGSARVGRGPWARGT